MLAYAAAIAVGMCAAGILGFFALLVGLMRASRRGYQAGTMTLVVVVAVLAVSVALSVSVERGVELGAFLFPAFPLIALGAPAAALVALPRRPHRRIFSVHRVSFPYVAIGRTVFVVACIGSVVLAFLSWRSDGSLRMAAGILCLGSLLGLSVKLLFTSLLAQPNRAVKTFQAVMADDPRPPIVFMRAFDRESTPFVAGPVGEYGRYSRTPRSSRQPTVHITLDEYLQPQIERQIGPFLALGNPQDYYTPVGAVRAYFKDDAWMTEFQQLARSAAGLIVEAAESTNLRWELQFLRQAHLHQRLVVIASHPTTPYGTPWMRVVAKMAGVPQVSWEGFAATMAELGYELPAGEPEVGTVIGFDADARAHVLTTDANHPEGFVDPMAAWLNGGRRDSPACVEATCADCGRRVWKAPHRLQGPFRCRACRAGSPFRQGAMALSGWIASVLAVPALIAILFIPTMLGFDAAWVSYAWMGILLAVFVAGLVGYVTIAERRAARARAAVRAKRPKRDLQRPQ